jgi:DNA-binding Xre family transcriptional regulator
MKKTKKTKSTYDRAMEDPKFRKLFEKEYKELVLSELILAMMEEDHISVRNLAKEIGMAPSVVQSMRSGKHENMTLKNFIKLITALGGELTIKKGDEYLPVKIAA